MAATVHNGRRLRNGVPIQVSGRTIRGLSNGNADERRHSLICSLHSELQPDTHFTHDPFAGLPRKHFSVGYVDPPWDFRAWSRRGEGKSARRHYACPDLNALAVLPVGELMAPDSALFFWVTQPLLPEALKVLEAWGFSFRTVAFVWIKMPKSWSEYRTAAAHSPAHGSRLSHSFRF